MSIRQNIVDLAMKMDGTGRPIPEDDPLYICYDALINDEQADLINLMERRVPITAEELAEKSGKTLEDTERILEEVRMIGLIEDIYKHGRKEWEMLLIIPGMAENVVLNKEQFKKHSKIITDMFVAVSTMPPFLTPMIPVGGAGLAMHAIPIVGTIPAGTKTVPHEEIEYWLKKYDFISVQDCQCRTVQKERGEWCGHTIKDRCFYFGDAGRYIVSTGRGRRVDYDEALQIMREAEAEGMMHQCSNIDGPDEIFTICNCCNCGCHSLKNSLAYNLKNPNCSNFVATVDPEKCAACGECVEYCPANAAKLGQALCMKVEPEEPEIRVLKPEEWGPEYWNPDYRTKKDYVQETGTSPCKVECPAHISVQAYIRLAAQGKYRDALELIKKENPFPAICGRVCPHNCESACTRGCIDEGVSIDEIKKFIAEQELKSENKFLPKKFHDFSDIRIAVIGSGPAGLSNAYYLSAHGYSVTVFEKENKLGGMMTLGIPSFRLEKDIINEEINILKEMGVEFKTGVEVGKDVTIEQLREEGYKAFYLAIGLQSGGFLNVPGGDSDGMISGVDLMHKVNNDEEVVLNGKVIVIGGGNVACDVARTAVRCGASQVDMYCLESEAEMPCSPEDKEEALEDGIVIHNSWGPLSVSADESGHVNGITFKKCLSTLNGEGKFAPVYDENETIDVECTTVLYCIGQKVIWNDLLAGTKVELNPNGTVKADPVTYQTADPDIFVGGDVYTGAKFIINAIAAGKEAAGYMHHYVQPGMNMEVGIYERKFKALDKDNLIIGSYDDTPRQKVSHKKDSGKFEDSRVTFTEEQLKKETERCLKCGVSVINETRCLGCGLCVTKCKFDAITLEKKFDGKFVSVEEQGQYLEPEYILKVRGKDIIRESVKK